MSFFDNLVSAWTFEDGSNLGKDSFGANNLTNNNAVPQIAGKIGHAASFNGTNQSLSIASNPSLILRDTSWELTTWLNPSNPLPTNGFFPAAISKWGSGGLDYLLMLNGTSSGRIEGDATPDGSTQSGVFGSGSEGTGVWYFVDMWFDFPNTTLHMQINNAAVSGPTASLTNTFNGTANFVMGVSAFGSPFFKGGLDGVNLWRRNLSTGERTALWNGGAGLEYPFNTGRRRVSSYLIR